MIGLALAAALSAAAPASDAPPPQIDRDLMDITVEGLHALYQRHAYTVSDVVRWHLDRIARYNGVYRPVQSLLTDEALGAARREDEAAKAPGFRPGPLWGVPIVIKANTSLKGR